MKKSNTSEQLDPLPRFRIPLKDFSKSPVNKNRSQAGDQTPEENANVCQKKSNYNFLNSNMLSNILDRDKFKKRESMFVNTALEDDDPNQQNKNLSIEQSIHEEEELNEHCSMKNDISPQNEIIISENNYLGSTPRFRTDDEHNSDKEQEFKLDEPEMLRRPSIAVRRSSFINYELNTFNARNSLFEDVNLSKRTNDQFFNISDMKVNEYYQEDLHTQPNIQDINPFKNSPEKQPISIQESTPDVGKNTAPKNSEKETKNKSGSR